MLSKRRIKGESKQNEPALRHKVRNLRAKVRLLLPMDVCCKEQKRSQNLLKLSYNKAMQQQNKLRRWCHNRENSQQLFIPHQAGRSEKHLFHKLTAEEIEQIKQDKMYYLGEQFITEFDNFLENRNRSRLNNHNILLQTQIISQTPVLSIQETEERNCKWHQTSSTSTEFNLNKQKHKKMDWHIRQVIKFQGMRQKRKMLNEQELTRRVYVKMKLKQKQQRMQTNHQKMMQTKLKTIKQRNALNDVKSSHSIRTKKNMRQLGEITDLSEKLRNVCLFRASKSANLLFRS